MKLNDLKDNEGAHHRRMRIGRGEGSGKGKTGGRGVKGQKARTGHGFKQFEGGQMPLHMRMPKRGFNNPGALKFAEVNLWRLSKAIEAGRLDPKTPIDAAVLQAAGVIRRELDGVRILGHGEINQALTITAYSASASAQKAIAEAGGSLTLTKVVKVEEA